MEDLIIKHCPVCNLIPIVAVRDDHWTVFCVKCNVNVTPKPQAIWAIKHGRNWKHVG